MNAFFRGLRGVLALLALFALASQTRVWAAAGSESASFLDIPVGARPAALGGAYGPLATDAYAPIYNPGGLGFADGTQVAGQHLAYLESIHYEHLAFLYPLKPGSVLAVSGQYLGSGDITERELDGSSRGTFSSHYGAYSLAYGRA